MEDGSVNEEDLKETEDVLKEQGVAGHVLSHMLKSMKAKGRGGAKYVNAIALMSRAVRLSQDAEKAYWDYHKEGPKSRADFARAEELLGRGIRSLDRAMLDFPTTTDTLMPVRKKLSIQYLDVQHQRRGKVVSPEELEKEYEASQKAAPIAEDAAEEVKA